MAAKRPDRLAPPLMYAFRAAHLERDSAKPVDIRENGERVLASRRVTARSPISESELRKVVGADLSALFNTVNLEAAEDLSTAPEVRRSILNFGIANLTRLTIDENAVNNVAQYIETALRDFEPRVARGSVKARRDLTAEPEALRVRFLVEAELRVEPIAAAIEFVAEVEVDSGKIKISRL